MIIETKSPDVRPVVTKEPVAKSRLAILVGAVVLLVFVATVWAMSIQEETPMAASDRAIEYALRNRPVSTQTVEIGRHHDYALRHMPESTEVEVGRHHDYALRHIDD